MARDITEAMFKWWAAQTLNSLGGHLPAGVAVYMRPGWIGFRRFGEYWRLE